MARNTPTRRTTTNDASGDDCSLDRFERNRFFHGKLMTARDMAADQRYHRGRHRVQARHVGGSGAVCGLDVTVTDTQEGGVSVRVGEGYAVDGCGHPIVVDNEFSETFGAETVDATERVAVWIRYAECDLESVPVRGAEDACDDECAFNRVLEISEIQCQNYDGDDLAKPVPSVRFPTKGDLSSHGDGALSATDPGLATIAQSFNAADGGEAACDQQGGRVFLGVYEPADAEGEPWSRVPGASPRARVYTNDMLYAATARHTADFANPHQSSLETEAADDGAAVHVADDRSDDADVTLTSSDSVLTVRVDEDAQEIDLSTGAALEKLIETRIAPMEQYIMDKSLKYTYRIFSGVASTYDTETAGQIAEKTKAAVDERSYASKEQYYEFIAEIHSLQKQLVDELSGQVTEETMGRYEADVERQGTVLENVEDKGVLALAVAQDEVVEAADWFERPEMPPIEIPGTTLPGGSLIPTNPLQPIDPTLIPDVGSGEEGDGGGSAPIQPITPQPIDPTQPTLPNQPIDPTQPITPTVPIDPSTGTGGTTPLDPTTPVTMPDFTGQTKETVENTLSNTGVQTSVTTQPVDDSTTLQGAGVNEVTDQSPAPGETVQPGQSVAVTVNQPPAVTRLPEIDETTAENLAEQGVQSVGDVASADTSTLTDAGLSVSAAEDVTSRARNYVEAHQLTKVEGIGTDEAEALADAANVTTIGELRATPNEQIEATAEAAADSGTVSRETAETVTDLDLETVTQNANSVAVQSQPVSEAGGTVQSDTSQTGGTTQTSGTAASADAAVVMPDLTGQTKETAEQTLANAGIQATVESAPVEDSTSLEGIGVNEVTEQSPAPGETVESGGQATITVNEPPSVTRISGIGDATASKLADAGIETVGELATADAATVAEATGASESRVTEMQSAAQKYSDAYQLTRVPGIGTDEAEALADSANVTTTQNLENASAETITAATEGAKQSGTVSETTAETVQNLNLEEVKTNLTTLGQ